jgi:hypothetical protein
MVGASRGFSRLPSTPSTGTPGSLLGNRGSFWLFTMEQKSGMWEETFPSLTRCLL